MTRKLYDVVLECVGMYIYMTTKLCIHIIGKCKYEKSLHIHSLSKTLRKYMGECIHGTSHRLSHFQHHRTIIDTHLVVDRILITKILLFLKVMDIDNGCSFGSVYFVHHMFHGEYSADTQHDEWLHTFS